MKVLKKASIAEEKGEQETPNSFTFRKLQQKEDKPITTNLRESKGSQVNYLESSTPIKTKVFQENESHVTRTILNVREPKITYGKRTVKTSISKIQTHIVKDL